MPHGGHAVVYPPVFPSIPHPIWRSANALPQICAYISVQPRRKKTSVGRNVTCRHLLKHLDSWILSPYWGVHGNQSHSSVINAALLRIHAYWSRILILAYIHTRHYKAAEFTYNRKWIQHRPNVFVQRKQETEKGMCVCGCITINREVCVLSGDWSDACMCAREDLGRGQSRLWQIDLSESASGRSNWLDKGNTFLQVPLFYCA